MKKIATEEGSVARLEKKLWSLIQQFNIDEVHLSEDMLNGCIRYSRLAKDPTVNKLLLFLWLKRDDSKREKDVEEINGYDLFKIVFKSNNQFYSYFEKFVSETLKNLKKPNEEQGIHLADLLINSFNSRNKNLENYVATISYFILLKHNNRKISDWKNEVENYLIGCLKKVDFEKELNKLPLNISLSRIEEKVTLMILDNILRNITSIN